jgi:cell volume regulation protein A
MLMRLPQAGLIFNVAFIVVLASLLVQGWSLGYAARLFDVALPHRDRAVRRVEVDLPGSLERELVGYPVAPDAAILDAATLPGWAKLAMIVRGGEIHMADGANRIEAGDYVYLLAPPGRVYRLDWLFAPPEEAREAERELFGEFSFAAAVKLGDVAAFYALPIRERDAHLTLGEHFARAYEHTVEIGDRVRLGPVILIARELDEDRVSRVGLKMAGVQGALARHPGWLGPKLASWFARRLFRD